MRRAALQSICHATQRRSRPVVTGAALADLVCVTIFVVIGRNTHDDGVTLRGVLHTEWPFALGVAGGYLGLAIFHWHPMSARGAGMVISKTVVLGLVLRYCLARDGAPASFDLVAALFLTATMGGWRLLCALMRRTLWRTLWIEDGGGTTAAWPAPPSSGLNEA